jgi:putative iron-regulated protein
MVGGTTVDRHALAGDFATGVSGAMWPAPSAGPERLFAAQADAAGEGGAGEGGGQVLGTITEFRLTSTDPGAFVYDAAAQVAAYADLVHAAYAAAHEGALALQRAIADLLAAPSEATLDAARAAWLAGRPAYLRTEAFQFYAGPVDAPGGPLPRLNAWPIDPGFVDGVIADPSVPLGFRGLARMNQADGPGQVTTGWHVIEYLLWGADGQRPSTDFAAGEGANDRRREYLAATAQLLVNDLGVLVAAWAPGQNNYRAAVEAMDQRNAIGRAFNGMTVLVGYEIPLRRIGAGLFPANANFQPSPFSDSSALDNRHAFEGARAVYYDAGSDSLRAAFDPARAA